jgi:hypothetical protein
LPSVSAPPAPCPFPLRLINAIIHNPSHHCPLCSHRPASR